MSKLTKLSQVLLEKQLEVLNNRKFDLKDKDLNGLLVAVNLYYSEKEEVQRIKNALQRIENNTYGICSQCGKSIEMAKLIVNPQGVTCISCTLEKNSKSK